MKRIVLLVLLFAWLTGFSQTAGYKYLVSFGLGGSYLGTASHLAKNQYIDMNISPEFDLHFKVFATDNIAVGMAGGWQRFVYSGQIDTIGSSLAATKWNFGLSAYWYYINKSNFVMYTGARAGLSYWHYRASANIDYYLDNYFGKYAGLVKNYIKTDGTFSYSLMSFQVTLIGVGVYPVKQLGFYGELAVGSPYWFNLGLNYRFNSSKVKKAFGV